jgi:S1-C subfamily serine protease
LRTELGYEGEGRVVVEGVAPGSPADRAGLVPGLCILEADFRPVTRPRDMLAATADGRVLLRVENRDGEAAYVVLQQRN